ncbi:MAG: AraC family transcriptional regulator, partial [Spirochaetaceae bacterium]
HRIEASPDEVCDYYNVTFLPECLSIPERAGIDDRLLEPFYSATPTDPIVLCDAEYDRAAALCRSIAHEVEQGDPFSPAIAVHLFHALLLLVARNSDDSGLRTDARVRSALRLIAERFDEPLPSRDLARAVGVSPSRLAQLFRSHTAATIRQTINRRRLTEAKRLLATTDEPITTILHESGFSDVSYFNRVFRADTGLTPREYRRRAVPHE